jgi:hypothetical protein
VSRQVADLRADPRRGALAWFGCLGAPLAWATQFAGGYAFAEAACGNDNSVDDLETVVAWLSAAMALVAIGSLAAAVATHRALRRGELADPRGRVGLMATAGIVAGILFLALIAFTGAMLVPVDACDPG